MTPPAITIDSASKTFVLPHRRYSTLKERVLHPFRTTTFDELRAVDNITVDIAEGEFFGIVGRNGSGKSTLLKCLAGIYRLDNGRININGRLSPFIELGVGLNPDMTARENVLINAVMLGLTRKQARRQFDEIIEFAELGEFLDLKLKNYSSGMSVRLAFSVAIQVQADVLLVDEVLAVGDANFQQKCFEQFQRLKDEGRTIVFVTHDMGAVQRFCDRAMLLERGKMIALDEPEVIGQKYNELNFGGLVFDSVEGERHGARPGAEITSSRFEVNGEAITSLPQGDAFELVFDVSFHEDLVDPIFAATLRNDARHTIFATSSIWDTPVTGSFRSGEKITVRIALDSPFAASKYTFTPSVARAGSGADALDTREDAAAMIIHSTRSSGGVVEIPHEISVVRDRAEVLA